MPMKEIRTSSRLNWRVRVNGRFEGEEL